MVTDSKSLCGTFERQFRESPLMVYLICMFKFNSANKCIVCYYFCESLEQNGNFTCLMVCFFLLHSLCIRHKGNICYWQNVIDELSRSFIFAYFQVKGYVFKCIRHWNFQLHKHFGCTGLEHWKYKNVPGKEAEMIALCSTRRRNINIYMLFSGGTMVQYSKPKSNCDHL